jgi:hypothetical protein
MPATDFKAAMDEFLTPIIDILNTNKPTCKIHRIYPNEPERNTCSSWPSAEVQHYLTSMISEGYLASVRFGSGSDGGVLQIALWEEWDGGFRGAHWPASDTPAEFESVWSGVPAHSGKG